MSSHLRQFFGIATYDALFKRILNDDAVRASFLHAFIPSLRITDSKRVDDHLNPLKELEKLRHLIHDPSTEQLVHAMQCPSFEVHLKNGPHKKCTQFLKDLLKYFEDIRHSFPKAPMNGAMDFVCQLDHSDEYVLVEMQIIPQDYWDQRALAYLAAIYARQLHQKDDAVSPWKKIRRIIGINILGGGKDSIEHWRQTPEQYARHYRFQEQLNKESSPRFLDGIELFQYALKDVENRLDDPELKEWVIFFRRGHYMTPEEVKEQIKTPGVLKAFELSQFDHLPKEVEKEYWQQDRVKLHFTECLQLEREEAEAKGLQRGLQKGLEEGLQKGLEEGLQKGLEEGLQKGLEEAKSRLRKAALSLLQMGNDPKMVCACLSISEEELTLLTSAVEENSVDPVC